jgi:hypothetical protein
MIRSVGEVGLQKEKSVEELGETWRLSPEDASGSEYLE